MNRTKIPSVLTRQQSDSTDIVLHKKHERLLRQKEDSKDIQFLDFPASSTNNEQLSYRRKRTSSPRCSFSKETQILSPSLNKLRKRVSITISDDPLLHSSAIKQDNEPLIEDRHTNKTETLVDDQQTEQRLDENAFLAFQRAKEESLSIQGGNNLRSCCEPQIETTSTENMQQKVSPQIQGDRFSRSLWPKQEHSLSNFNLQEDSIQPNFPEITAFHEPWLSLEKDIIYDDTEQDPMPFFWTDFF